MCGSDQRYLGEKIGLGCVLWELAAEVVCEFDCQVKGTFVPVANAVLGNYLMKGWQAIIHMLYTRVTRRLVVGIK